MRHLQHDGIYGCDKMGQDAMMPGICGKSILLVKTRLPRQFFLVTNTEHYYLYGDVIGIEV